MRIATHNSATGEPGHGLISWLVTPFAKCQSKTITEQLEAGVRYFDIRVKKTKRGWVGAHGIWESKKNIQNILSEINAHGKCYVNITYEGEAPYDFMDTVLNWISVYKYITFCRINVKKPLWKTIRIITDIDCRDYFLYLDYSTWHTYLPIPWLWKKIYYNKPIFNDDYYTFVDFI